MIIITTATTTASTTITTTPLPFLHTRPTGFHSLAPYLFSNSAFALSCLLFSLPSNQQFQIKNKTIVTAEKTPVTTSVDVAVTEYWPIQCSCQPMSHAMNRTTTPSISTAPESLRKRKKDKRGSTDHPAQYKY